MEKEYFVQQSVFIEDYKKVAKKGNVDIDALADQVISQLNETQEKYYIMDAEESNDQTAHRFPFSRRIYSD